MRTLFMLNDARCGTEPSYDGLRLAGNLAQGAHSSTIDALADWVAWADTVVSP
jgi:hypothetical protein